jgi:hypothetical protein
VGHPVAYKFLSFIFEESVRVSRELKDYIMETYFDLKNVAITDLKLDIHPFRNLQRVWAKFISEPLEPMAFAW